MKPQTLDRLTTAALLSATLGLYLLAGAIDAPEFDAEPVAVNATNETAVVCQK